MDFPVFDWPAWAVAAVWSDGQAPVFAGRDMTPRDRKGRFCGGPALAALKQNAAPAPWPFAAERRRPWLN